MRNTIAFLVTLLLSISMLSCSKTKTRVIMTTTMGEIHLELYDNDAPVTVKNFLSYVDSKYYEGTIFHRVIPNFMIQGGGFTVEMVQKETDSPIKNEASSKISNKRGTIAMARTNNPHSATSQFFINTKDNNFLDYGPRNPGYCVFGRVTKGIEIVDAISKISTHREGFQENVPDEPVIISSVKRVK